MSNRKVFDGLLSAVENTFKSSHRHHMKQLEKKQKALVAYQKMNALKIGKQWTNEEEGAALDSVAKQLGMNLPPTIDFSVFSHLEKVDKDLTPKEAHHLTTIAVFLNSQTEYCDLLERYNPGISQQQTDKVKKTARRVGLEVPE